MRSFRFGQQRCLAGGVVQARSATFRCRPSLQTSATTDPIMRKNPELYTQLSQEDGTTLEQQRTRAPPEVLAPAGGWPQLKAAVQNGADAVYFGVEAFNARARAANFSVEELPEVVEYLHQRGVKGYVALNVLIFDEELTALQALVHDVARAGADAVIVQDIGAVLLMRALAPSLPVHGSTQMSITSGEGADFAVQLGVQRVVVGRELSVRDIQRVGQHTDAEVEAFVHGALCVSYSGQCYSSEAWGGRSANRGQCAQACRLPYGLLVDGSIRELGDVYYLLSPQDLMAVDYVPQLVDAGVRCFKIEGRLKGPEYVAATTAVYRQAVDAALSQPTSAEEGHTSATPGISEAQRQMLQQVFARGQDIDYDGLSPGFLPGTNHQAVVRGRAPRHRGMLVGTLERAELHSQSVSVVLACTPGAAVKRGDGLVFDGGVPDAQEQGGAVYDVQEGVGGRVTVVFGRGHVDVRQLRPGMLVWRTKDPALESALRATFESVAESDQRKLPVHASVSGSLGTPLRLTLQAPGWPVSGAALHAVTVCSKVPLTAARGRPMTRADVAAGLGAGLGGAFPIGLASLDCIGLDEGLFFPAKELKALRRQAVEALMPAVLRCTTAQGLREDDVLATMMPQNNHAATPATHQPMLRVLCRSAAQVHAALRCDWLEEVIVDFLEVHGLKDAVNAVQAAGRRCVVATPRVLKPDEQRLWRFYLGLKADALLVRSAGMLMALLELGGPGAPLEDPPATIPALEGDFSLNTANAVTAQYFLQSIGLTRLAPTHDCNAAQIAGMAQRLGSGSNLEVILHQHLPIFHTEHCVFARFLSEGSSYKDCGHPCERHTLHLRDGQAQDHLVLADMGCRNTVFNAQAQSGVYHLPALLAVGVGCFRVELVDEPADAVVPLLEGYAAVLAGRRSARSLWEELGDVGGGSLDVKAERQRETLRPTARR